ncbi:MAG TPA: hypothetical protein VNX65_00170 [Patescibacteria group bacterium]|nr:hypothetical protein [Patescibacteria group bacterium]
MNTQNPKKQLALWSKRHSKGLKIGLITVTIYIVTLFVPLVSSYTKYPLYVVRCGGLPIAGTHLASARGTYSLPGEMSWYTFFWAWLFEDYFCSETEAQAAGYVKDSYSN